MSTEKTAIPEEVWMAIKTLAKSQEETNRKLKETDRKFKETDKKLEETDRKFKETGRVIQESQKETNRVIQESQEKTEESLQGLSENVKQQGGNFNRKWGNFLESFVSGDLVNLLETKGIKVRKIIRKKKSKRSNKTIESEHDIIATNGKEIVVMEVKTTLSSNDVKKFFNKLKLFKERFPKYKDNIVYGGIAYLGQVPEKDSATTYANKLGFFLFQAPGGKNNVTIMTNKKNFKPKAF